MARYRPKQFDPAPRHMPVVRLLLLAALLVGTAALCGTAARYFKSWSDGSLVTAQNFCFTSDKLGGGAPYPLEVDENGQAVFPFTLRNYLVKSHPTQGDITYTLSVTDAAGHPVSAQWQNGAAADNGTLPGGMDSLKALRCLIPAAAFQDAEGNPRTLTVTAASTAPYAAALTAQVVLATGDGGVVWMVTDPGDGSGAVAVTLYNTGGLARAGTLSWPDADLELVPDPTGDVLPSAGGKLTVPAQSAVSVVFLKKNTERRFTEGDFGFQVSQGSH